ncbi:MAG: hypothetical protein IJ300_00005, partial [Clostridia bacterium]|nr:hypothetical protein [Clostridia bacterium]
RWILPKAKYGGRENADIMQFFNYPSVTYGDSSPDKGSHDLYFIDKLKAGAKFIAPALCLCDDVYIL